MMGCTNTKRTLSMLTLNERAYSCLQTVGLVLVYSKSMRDAVPL